MRPRTEVWHSHRSLDPSEYDEEPRPHRQSAEVRCRCWPGPLAAPEKRSAQNRCRDMGSVMIAVSALTRAAHSDATAPDEKLRMKVDAPAAGHHMFPQQPQLA